jgi:hypothetical protein
MNAKACASPDSTMLKRLQMRIVKAQTKYGAGSLNRVPEGLSCMRGNSHVRFLGEGPAVMLLFYPSNKRNLCDAIVI